MAAPNNDDENYRIVPGSEHEEEDNHISFARSFEDDDDEDDLVLRRYHTSVKVTPAEFDSSVFRRVWHSLEQERIAARQRTAARMLATHDTPKEKFKSFCATWFCDATDRGILLAALLCVVWLVVGSIMHAKRGYWVFGMLLFGLRVSARRIAEAIGMRRRHQQLTHHAQYISPTNSSGMV